MSPAPLSEKTSNGSSRCEERSHLVDHGKGLTPGQQTDAALQGTIERALWKDDVLRAIEVSEMEVHVKDRVVYLEGHIAGASSQVRIQNAMRTIPNLLGVQNNLILDDRLTVEVAVSLGALEHTYGCKFFTGASHGVISLNGTVTQEAVKWLAETCVSSHPNVRAVINNVHVLGAARGSQAQPFLQPIVGQTIYFPDGTAGVVTQVIINPNNRRVVAMILRGQFAGQAREHRSTNDGQGQPPERRILVPVERVRHMTRVSGFLHADSADAQGYLDFDPTRFSSPANDWKAPHPYCPEDVLFPVEKREVQYQILERLPRSPFVHGGPVISNQHAKAGERRETTPSTSGALS